MANPTDSYRPNLSQLIGLQSQEGRELQAFALVCSWPRLSLSSSRHGENQEAQAPDTLVLCGLDTHRASVWLCKADRY